MTTAEATSKSFVQISPNMGVKFLWVQGTSAADSDTMTISELNNLKGAFLKAEATAGAITQGDVATYTMSTNVLTLTNGGTAKWSGIVWGN